MAITYPLDLPDTKGFNAITLHARNVVAVTASEFNLKQQTFVHSGQRWEADCKLPPMKITDAEPWIAFLLSLKGMSGSFMLGDPIRTLPQGSASTTPGSPLVAGAGQSGATINIDGCPLSATNYLKAGDYVQFGAAATASLHKVLIDASTDGSGAVTLELWPDVRNDLSDNSTVVVQNCRGLFRLDSNLQTWNLTMPDFYGINFRAVEIVQ